MRESKGSAFVWFQTRQQAEAAIARYNLSRALPDPTGQQHRALVVRRANVRKPWSSVMATQVMRCCCGGAGSASRTPRPVHPAPACLRLRAPGAEVPGLQGHVHGW